MAVDIILGEERIRETTGSGLWPGKLIADYLDEAARARPDKPAIIEERHDARAPRTITFAELAAASRRAALGLLAAGIGPGDVVSFQLPNWWQFTCLHLACVSVGAVSNPLMPIYRARELAFMLKAAETKLMVVPTPFKEFDYAAMMKGLAGDLPALDRVFVVGEDFDAWFLDHDREDTDGTLARIRPGPDEATELLYTSGTTGEPKGVIHTHNTLTSIMAQHIRLVGLTGDDIVLQAAPIAHQAGFLHGVMMPIMLGATVVLQDVWDADEAARLIEAHGATYAMGATPFLADLADCGGAKTRDLSSFHTFVTAGAPIPRALVPRARERLGARIIASWGMTEFGTGTATQPDDPAEKISGTDGRPVPGVEMRIVDGNGIPLPAGEEGELQARGMSKFVGYVKRPDLYGDDPGGWFGTGDLARMDGDGYIRITGRAKDVIIRGGQNIPVVEIENLLYAHEAIREVAIVAMPDARLGERACAFVVLQPGAELGFAEMIAHLEAAGTAKSYLPEHLELIDALPTTPSGKVQKFKLRDRAVALGEAGAEATLLHATGGRMEGDGAWDG